MARNMEAVEQAVDGVEVELSICTKAGSINRIID